MVMMRLQMGNMVVCLNLEPVQSEKVICKFMNVDSDIEQDIGYTSEFHFYQPS